MNKKIKVNFIWQGLYGEKRYGHWNDGLCSAMKILERDYDVKYIEPSHSDIEDCNILLYWEAPVTIKGKDSENYKRIKNSKVPKILLFAGGPISIEDGEGFDMFLVESRINEEECESFGIPWMRAFGVDTDIMKPEKQPKVFDGFMPATCAGWKRQGLFSSALKEKGVLAGRFQESDSNGFLMARVNNTSVFNELPYHAVNSLYNMSWCCVNTSSYWGGGQRATLEAMAAGIPVIVMNDSPKNMEYVEESGAGLIVEPSESNIRQAVESIKLWTPEQRSKGRDYVLSKFTHRHYADNIIKAINKVLKI